MGTHRERFVFRTLCACSLHGSPFCFFFCFSLMFSSRLSYALFPSLSSRAQDRLLVASVFSRESPLLITLNVINKRPDLSSRLILIPPFFPPACVSSRFVVPLLYLCRFPFVFNIGLPFSSPYVSRCFLPSLFFQANSFISSFRLLD